MPSRRHPARVPCMLARDLPKPHARPDDGFALVVGDLGVLGNDFDSVLTSLTVSRDGPNCSARSTPFATSATLLASSPMRRNSTVANGRPTSARAEGAESQRFAATPGFR